MDYAAHAIEVVAALVATEALRYGIEHGISWEDYPEIGDDDWNQVVAEALMIAARSRPPKESFDSAYELLSLRASKEV